MAQAVDQVVKNPLRKCKKCKRIKRDCICGRPTKRTEKVVQQLEELFKLDFNVTQACGQLGIPTETYYTWRKQSDEFRRRMDFAKQYTNMLAKRQHTQGLLSGHPKHVLFHLANRAKDPENGQSEYTTKSEIQHSGTVDTELSEEDRALLEKFPNHTPRKSHELRKRITGGQPTNE